MSPPKAQRLARKRREYAARHDAGASLCARIIVDPRRLDT